MESEVNDKTQVNGLGCSFIIDQALTELAHKDDPVTSNKGLPENIKVCGVYLNNNLLHYLVYDYAKYIPLFSSKEVNDISTWIFNKINNITNCTIVVKPQNTKDIVEELFVDDDEDDYYYGILN